MIDLRPDHLAITIEILKAYVPDAEVRIFGSRVSQTAKDHSDLDLAIVAESRLSTKNITMLKVAFEESSLPFRVDVLDWNTISENFRKVIEKQYEVLQKSDNTKST